jgi:hypothetical protein
VDGLLRTSKFLQALQDTFVLGMLVGDADLCASVYSPDGRIAPGHLPEHSGRKQIRQYYQHRIDDGERGFAIVREGFEVHADLVIEHGVFARFPDPVKLGRPAARGTYRIFVERQHDDSWAWTADVWDFAP